MRQDYRCPMGRRWCGNACKCICIFSGLCVASFTPLFFFLRRRPYASTKGVVACIPLYTMCIGIVQFNGANDNGLWQRFLRQFTYQLAPIYLLFTPCLRQFTYFFLSFCANLPTFFSCALKVNRPTL
jgi:hypothetical protein